MRTLRPWTVLSLLAACLIPLLHMAILWPWFEDLPKWDQWSMIEVWEAHFAGRPVLPLLLAPYNGHLNVLPRLVFYGLGLVTGWSLRTEMVLLELLAAGTAAVLILMLRDSGERFLLLAAPVTLLVFSMGQYGSFLSGYGIGQHLCQLALTATIFVLTRPRISGRHVAAALVTAAIATFSWGSGVLAWPLGGVALLVRMRRRWGLLILWGSCMLAAALVVRQGAGPMASPFSVLTGSRFAVFALTLIGRPVSPQGFPEAGSVLVLGSAAVTALVLLLVWTWTLRQPLVLLRWGLLGISGLSAAGLIAVPRSPGSPEIALSTHYSCATYPAFLAALVLACCCLWAAMDGPATPGERRMAGAALVILFGLLAGRELLLARQLIPVLRNWAEISRTVGIRLQEGTITDDEIRRALHPDVHLVRRGNALLRRHRLALYRNLPASGIFTHSPSTEI